MFKDFFFRCFIFSSFKNDCLPGMEVPQYYEAVVGWMNPDQQQTNDIFIRT